MQLKCHQYWPLGTAEGAENEMVFNEVGIQISLQGENNCGNFITRWIEVTNLEVRGACDVQTLFGESIGMPALAALEPSV